jgi:hypothetical protein
MVTGNIPNTPFMRNTPPANYMALHPRIVIFMVSAVTVSNPTTNNGISTLTDNPLHSTLLSDSTLKSSIKYITKNINMLIIIFLDDCIMLTIFFIANYAA